MCNNVRYLENAHSFFIILMRTYYTYGLQCATVYKMYNIVLSFRLTIDIPIAHTSSSYFAFWLIIYARFAATHLLQPHRYLKINHWVEFILSYEIIKQVPEFLLNIYIDIHYTYIYIRNILSLQQCFLKLLSDYI